MSKPGEELVPFSASEAAIEPYKAGGIIEGALGAPERSMDRIIQEHLGTVAMLNARGDTVQERPTYVFNPDNGLLINYAYRRHHNRDREGLFADIVELDEEGRPRHGINAINPFKTSTGFINVAVGENNKGFAPSSVTLNLENDDPTSAIPPNIETADLLTMLQAEPISDSVTLEVFLAEQKEKQQEMRGRVQERHRRNYLPTQQAMNPDTDANLHLIVTDRLDTSMIEAASREVGIFPVVLPAQEVARAGMEMERIDAPDEVFKLLRTFVELGPERNTVREALTESVPAFVTVDYEWTRGEDDTRKTVTFPREGMTSEAWFAADSLIRRHGRNLDPNAAALNANPIFAKLFNYRYYPEDDTEVRKEAHGLYEMALSPSSVTNMETYTNWLRKVRLDFALTLYLRGLSQL